MKKMLKRLLITLGLAPTEEQQRILDKIKHAGYTSMRATGRRSFTMDAHEAFYTDTFQRRLNQAHCIVQNTKKDPD